MPHPIRLEPFVYLATANFQAAVQRFEDIMEWVPIFLITVKLLVLGTCIFFAIKSHHDGEKEEKEKEKKRAINGS